MKDESKLTLKELRYNYAWKMKLFPSSKQKQIIKANSDASRFIYNEYVGVNKRIQQTKVYLNCVFTPYTVYATYQRMYQQMSVRYLTLKHKDDKSYKCPVALIPNEMKLGLSTGLASVSLVTMANSIKTPKSIKVRYDFLQSKLIDAATLGEAQRAYKAAWNMFSKVHSAGVPKFKKKSYVQRYKTTNRNADYNFGLNHKGVVRFLDAHHVTLPKIGKIRIVHGLSIFNKMKYQKCRIGSASIKCDATGTYWLAITMASNQHFKKWEQHKDSVVGVDLNTENFYTDSNCNIVKNPKFYRNTLPRLKKKQRNMSRKQRRAKKESRNLRTSKNYQKKRIQYAKLQSKVANQRKYFLNQYSTALIKNHDLVVAEDLSSKNMLKNHAMAMSISDIGWRTFLQMLAYKAELHGTNFKLIDPKWTTQMCSDCGYNMSKHGHKLTLKDRDWTCPNCGEHHIRDHNAAINILNKGLTK